MKKNIQKPAWIVVSNEGLKQIWLGWRGISVLLGFSIFLSVYVVLLSLNPEINTVSHLNWINLTVKMIIIIGVAITLLLSANSISSERDGETLEVLLLTPIKRSHIVLGKILPILSLWLGMVLVTTPYLWLISQGTNIFLNTLLLFVILGTISILITSYISILISSFSARNITSFIVSFVTLSALIAPMQLPNKVQELPLIRWLIDLNPFTAMAKFQQLVLADGASITQHIGLLISPFIILVLLTIFIPKIINNYLTLFGGMKKIRTRKKPMKLLSFIVLGLFLFVINPLFSQALDLNQGSNIIINLDKDDIIMTAGNWDSFNVTISNQGSATTPHLIATGHIIRTTGGLFADPEDILTPITYYLNPINPGETVVKEWIVHGVFEGNFRLFITIVSEDTTFNPIISKDIPVNIMQNKILPLNQVVPVVSLVPLILSVVLIGILIVTNRKKEV